MVPVSIAAVVTTGVLFDDNGVDAEARGVLDSEVEPAARSGVPSPS